MTDIVTPAQLRQFSPHYAKDSIIVPAAVAFNTHAPKYGVNTRLRLANFWGEGCHETNQFQTLHEYGDAAYFAQYNNRHDIGNGPHDGPLFFGRGIFQITGRDNYKKFGALIGVDLIAHPERAQEPEISVLLALEYWKDRGLNALADNDNTLGVAIKINGRNKTTGLPNHYEERKAFVIHGKTIFNGIAA